MSRFTLVSRYPDFHIPERYSTYRLDPSGGGSGSLGIVKKFDSPGLPSIAVKKFTSPFQTKTRAQLILRELHLLKGMHHPHIVQMLDKYTVEGTEAEMDGIYHVTVHCGLPLSKIIEIGNYTMVHVKRWTTELLSAVQYLNSLGISHRNLHPNNMCISTINEQLTLTGFGKARVLDEKNTVERGTDPYMALEMRVESDGIYDEKVDIWSMAAILCEMVTGTVLFSGPEVKNLMKLMLEFCGPVDQAVLAKFKNPTDREHLARASIKARRMDFIPLLIGRIAGKRGISDVDIQNEPHLADFIDRTLLFNPRNRMTADQAIAHPFLSGVDTPIEHPLPENDDNAALKACRHHIWQEIHS